MVRNGPPDAVSVIRVHGLGLIETENLKYRIVLAVDRQQRRVVALDFFHQQVTGAHQAFLVGERHDSAAPNCRQRRGKSGRADNSGHDPIGGPCRRFGDRGRSCGDFRIRTGERILEVQITGFVRDDREAWA